MSKRMQYELNYVLSTKNAISKLLTIISIENFLTYLIFSGTVKFQQYNTWYWKLFLSVGVS